MTSLPFTFAYCNPGDPWNAVTMDRFDESIFSFKINHEEGQHPTLDLTIRNPRIGLLNPSRQLWAYLGYRHSTDGLIPIFHGVLVGIPTNMFKELITLQFLARSHTFIADKQTVAETMKVAPYYDPLWLDDSQRDQPDSILEGWSALWHIDRLTLATTASDVLVGEDGTVTFLESDAFYDSVGMSLDQPPLVNVRVEANVKWTQRASGYITGIPPVNIASYTGGSFLSDWPKPGTSLGGGYRVETSWTADTYHIEQTPTMSWHSNYHAGENPGQCGTESASTSSSGPALLTPKYLSVVLTEYWKSGVCFPDSDPPQNIPAEVNITGVIVPVWYVNGTMTLRYDAERDYGEYLSFDMIANVQGILASPTVDQDTELLTLNSVDLGIPLPQVKNWTDFAGQPVNIAQVIWPNNPTEPGGLAYQICVQAGTAGATEPVFSDLPGVTTNDGSVVWASLGKDGFSSSNVWSAGEGVPTGMVILMTNQAFNPNIGEMEDVIPTQTSYYICIQGGITNGDYTQFTYVPPVHTNDEPTPEPIVIDLFTPPTFSQTPGTIIQDGSVKWMVLGANPSMLAIPIGGSPDNVTANNFFPSARGQQSIEYLICRARARLRYRSRAVSVSWTSPFEKCVYLSCRKNATINDHRIPGAAATGKIVGYSLECDGHSGELRGNVKIGCSVGFGNSVAAITGTPEYANAGYAQAGWQRYDGATSVPGSNDTTYTKPYYVPFDDGLQYPLTWNQISDGGIISGTMAQQEAKIKASFKTLRVLTYLQNWSGQTISTGGTGNQSTNTGINSQEAWTIEREELALAAQSTPYVMEANPVSWTVLLKPCNGNGPFIGSYEISVSPLEVPQGINLAAPSNP
jgi:hypothetical protein